MLETSDYGHLPPRHRPRANVICALESIIRCPHTVKPVLLRERVDELWKDFVADDRLGEVVAVVGQSAQS